MAKTNNTGATNASNYRKKRDTDPAKRADYLEKRRLAYKHNKEVGKITAITDKSERQQRQQRKIWKLQKRDSRLKKKENILNEVQVSQPMLQTKEKLSSQKENGKKASRKKKVKCYQENKILKEEILNLKRKMWRMEKKVTRQAKKMTASQQCPDNKIISPRSKVNQEFSGMNINKKVKRCLVFGEALRTMVKKSPGKIKDKLFNRTALMVIKKYKMLHYLRSEIGISRQKIASRIHGEKTNVGAAKQYKKIIEERKKKVIEFYLREDVSRVTNGKKLTITRNKVKQQKRLLTDYMSVLHTKFLAENPSCEISYTNFTRLRPFWVVAPTELDRDTCMCKTCENVRLMLEKLYQKKVIGMKSLSDVQDAFTCKERTKECSYRECCHCKDKELELINSGYDNNEIVAYPQWVSIKETRQKMNVRDGSTQPLVVSRTVKEIQEDELYDIIQKFEESATRYCRHDFNIKRQYHEFKTLKENLSEDECIIQIDFSENYTLKYSSQIQSAHFGASLQQASLHTGIIHLGPSGQDTLSFCSISPNLQHGPPAIWVHLKPVFELLKNNHKGIRKIHFFSDGPCSQYRQKLNFYLFSTRLYEEGFDGGSWNFWEAGHGRGAADGVGGAIKRRADDLVRHGTDLADCQTFFNELSKTETKIKLFYVPEEDIISEFSAIATTASKLKPVNNTMKIHEIVTTERNQILVKDVSCFCSYPKLDCPCFNIATHTFPDTINEKIQDEEYGELVSLELSPSILDKWVVVSLGGKFYPGKVVSLNEVEILVKFMFANGVGNCNKFFWPKRSSIKPFDPDMVYAMNEPNIDKDGFCCIDNKLWEALQKRG